MKKTLILAAMLGCLGLLAFASMNRAGSAKKQQKMEKQEKKTEKKKTCKRTCLFS
jgi:ABC-type glycerol-3-phosphate transport system substrate-binding protein